MELRISINEKTLFALLIITAFVSAIGIGIAQVPDPGHGWDEIECAGCVTESNLADGSVTSNKADFNYAGSASQGGPADSALTALTSDAVDWDDIDNIPSDIADGDDNTQRPSCSWSNWGGTNCLSCNYGCQYSIAVLEGYCSGSRITQLRTTSCCVYCNPSF